MPHSLIAHATDQAVVHFTSKAANSSAERRHSTSRALPDVPAGYYQEREQLFAEFAPLVRRLLRQYGSDTDQRHDLAGEIYYRFCLLLEAFDPDRGVPLRPYLVRQLTASIYTYVRQQWTVKKREFSEDWSDPESAAEPSYDPTGHWIASLSQEQILDCLPHAIEKLPKRQRQVVIWRYYDDLAFEEIARLLSVEQATCRSLLRHGLNNLRKQMQTSNCAPC